MAEEFYVKDQNYYGDYLTNVDKFIPVQTHLNIAIEKFIACLLFKNDLSRVIYATPDITFRRRVELMDTAKGKQPAIQFNPLTLNLPYASYSQTGQIEPDDRPWTQQAAESVVGVYDEESGKTVRYNAFKMTYEIICFYARHDETRLAAQLLYWEQEPKSPVWMVSTIYYRGSMLRIPCFLTIDEVDITPEYKESTFLEESRIFPIKIKVTMRSYQVLVNSINKIYTLPIRWGNKHSPETRDWDEPELYIVDEVVLLWACEKWGLNRDIKELSGSTLPVHIAGHPKVEVVVDNYFKRKSYFTREQAEDDQGNLLYDDQGAPIWKYTPNLGTDGEQPQLFYPSDESLENESDGDKSYGVKDIDGNFIEAHEHPGPYNYYSEDELKQILGYIPNYETNEIIKGYFVDSTESILEYCYFKDNTDHSLRLVFKVKEADKQYFYRLTLLTPGHNEVETYDQNATELILDKLYPNSEYSCKVLIESKSGIRYLIALKGLTLDNETNMAPQPNEINRRKGNALLFESF